MVDDCVKNELQIAGSALAQTVSRQSLNFEVRIYCRANACEICDGENGTGTGFFLNKAEFFLSVSLHNAPHSLIHHIRYMI